VPAYTVMEKPDGAPEFVHVMTWFVTGAEVTSI
jgi:hypothetical protein